MNQALYNDVWQQLLDAERCCRYHYELAGRYRKYQKIPRWIMAVSSVVGATSVFTRDWIGFADVLYVPAALLMLSAVVWDLMHDHGEKAAILKSISVECAELETELKDLWRSVYTKSSIDEVQVNSRLREIESRLERVTSRSADIKVDEELNEKSQKEGFKVISDRYTNSELQTT
ncbi:MAG: hypothetical protein F4X92_02530 [Gammaproteobacteria bacterium]|nr:hypothetical protein [Gammaproteobacteria bacterium]